MNTLISIIGPTASGKTSLALELAEKLASPILSCDSRQFYREMPIGTAAPTLEEQRRATHYFVGHIGVEEPYSIGAYEKDAMEKIQELFKMHSTLVLVGGSMMYEKAVIHGLHPLPAANAQNQEKLLALWQKEGLGALQNLLHSLDPIYSLKVDLQNPRRLLRAIDLIWQTGQSYTSLLKQTRPQRDFRVVRIGMQLERQLLYERIEQRVDQMIAQGLLGEVEALLPFKELPSLNTVGYRELFPYLLGETTLKHAIEEIKKNTRRFAKRQLTWYRGEEDIHWVAPPEAISQAEKLLEALEIR